MKKYLACGLAMAVLACFTTSTVHAEQSAPVKRQFKTWTVDKTTPAATKPKEPLPAWKQKLALKASAKAKQQAKQHKGKNKEIKQPVAPVQRGNNAVYTDSWRIKSTQQKLKQLGYSSEPATGKMTSATKDALLKFQKKNNLTAHGKLDDRTYRRLNWLTFNNNGIKNISGDAVVREAAKYRGVRYVFGGTTPKGFDCSGYVQYVFKQLHANLPRTADVQALEGVFVTQGQLKPGDLVFFSTYEPGASHVGIYAGNGKFWNATSSKGIMLCGLRDYYWCTRYYGARRVLVSNGEPGL